MSYRIHLCWGICISTLISTIVVVLQLVTLLLEMSLHPTLKTSRPLTCPIASLIVTSISIGRAFAVASQMANAVALVAFWGTWAVMVVVSFGTKRFGSS
ncbi:hypothetical protein Tco_0305594, partial [Tanacetum coccineum]